ncbi:hypothetical protein GGF46_003356 [Coemansia sp. RSA 552]|nr:hypothetical protein GGF46_003356 [Coemansia sp. RSA 552]
MPSDPVKETVPAVKSKGKERSCEPSSASLPMDVDNGEAVRKDSAVDTTEKPGAERAGKLIDHHIEYLRIRQSICASIETGEPKVALELLSSYFRAVLIPPPSTDAPPAVSAQPIRREFNAALLRFRLDTQYYVELIAKHQELDALQFGQRTLWRYPDIFETWLDHSLAFHSTAEALVAKEGEDIVPREELKQKRAEIMQHITDVAALVAYPDPHKSSLAYLLSQERRNELSAAVNSAILAAMHFPREPALATLVRQLATTSKYLFGYRPSPSSRTPSAAPETSQPWVLDTFVNSDSVSDTLA